MSYFKQGNNIILVGEVLREAKLRETRNGKQVSSFYMQYGFHHDEDGKSVKDCIDVSMWGEHAKFVGDEDIGVAKGDYVMVVGYLTKDTYHTEKDGEDKYKVNADIVLDMTSIFQVAQMVVSPSEPAVEDVAPQKRETVLSSGFTDVEDGEGDPFMTEDDELIELPY